MIIFLLYYRAKTHSQFLNDLMTNDILTFSRSLYYSCRHQVYQKNKKLKPNA